MKKWMIWVVVMMLVAGTQAQQEEIAETATAKEGAVKTGQTKAEFLAEKKAKLEKRGKEFDSAKWEKIFSVKDRNKDGVLNEADASVKSKRGKKNKNNNQQN